MTAPTPLRSGEEVMGAFVSVTLGGQARSLPELPRVKNREFQKVYAAKVRETIASVGEINDLEAVMEMMSSSIDEMLDIILIYDETGALGGREWIDYHATDREVYEAFKKVTEAAHPFGKDLIAKNPVIGRILLEAAIRVAGSKSLSSSQPSTAGGRKRSKVA